MESISLQPISNILCGEFRGIQNAYFWNGPGTNGFSGIRIQDVCCLMENLGECLHKDVGGTITEVSQFTPPYA